MARSPLVFAVNLKVSSGGRVRLGVGHLVDVLSGSDLVATPMKGMLESLAEIAQREAVSASRSRGVAGSIFTEIEPTLARVRIPLAYGATLNKGRKPGIVGGREATGAHIRPKMPSTNQLREWAASHGWQGSLFVLARSIQRRGIKGRFFMRKARAAVRRAMPDHVERMSHEIERRFG